MYRFLRPLNNLILKTFFRLKVEEGVDIPKEGPLIMAANHESLIDGFILAALTKRQITFLAAKFLFDIRFVGWFLRSIGAIAVKKEGQNLESLRRALKVLENGGIVALFPEGGIYESDLYFGAVYLAAKSGAPILPLAIFGAERALPPGKRLMRPAKISVRIGELTFIPKNERPSREFLEEETGLIRHILHGLMRKVKRDDIEG